MDRRMFLRALAAAPIATPAYAQDGPIAPPLALNIVSRTIDVNGRSAKVFGIVGPNRKPGVTRDAGAIFDVSRGGWSGNLGPGTRQTAFHR